MLIPREMQSGCEVAQLFLGLCRAPAQDCEGGEPLHPSHLFALGQETAWHRVPNTARRSALGESRTPSGSSSL